MATQPLGQLTTFVWEGKDKKGRFSRGEITAPSQGSAEIEVKKTGITISRIYVKPKVSRRTRNKKVNANDIILFTRNLSTMLDAGLPIITAFDILARGEEKPSMQSLLNSVKAEMVGGGTLAEGLAKHPEQFDKLFCGLIRAGEQSGTLTAMLKRLSTYIERTYYIKKKVKKAMIYPAVVVSVAVVVSCILLFFVVPKFQMLFSSFGKELPFFTQLVVKLSNFLRRFWWLIFGGGGLAIYMFRYRLKHNPKFAEQIDNILLKTKIIGPLLRKIIIARFARVLSTTLAAGMPIVEAIQSAANIQKPGLFKNAILKIKERVEAGEQLNTAMGESGLFPVLVVQMIAVGEESGSLDSMLTKVAAYYEEEVDTAVDNLNSLMEPLIMVVLGGIIGCFVAAMYLPIFKMGSALG